jgi:hypothetical protein
MNRTQLDAVAALIWPDELRHVSFIAPEVLGYMMFKKTGDPQTCVLNQLFQECEQYRRCVTSGEEEEEEWPAPPGQNYPGNYNEQALRLMDLVEKKEAWQYRLCAHFRESM